jgi:Protein of unknown function (DUF1565)
VNKPALVLLALASTFVVLHCGGESPDCVEAKTCAEPGTDGGGSDVAVPEGCDANADPKDAPKCVVNEFGVFVDGTNGNDANAGTRESPMKTINGALAKTNGKPRVYICDGTYEEHVKLTTATSLYGGFACGSWTPSGAKAKVAPNDEGHALAVIGVASLITVSDLEFAAIDAASAGGSSVALFFSESTASLRRVNASAGKGQKAEPALTPPTNLFGTSSTDLDGNGGSGTNGGLARTCACKSYGATTGGKGGSAGSPAETGQAGSSTPMPAAMGGRNGNGGAGYPNQNAFACESGKPGADGVPRAAGVGASAHGTLKTTGWSPAAGSPGEAGNPGGGGGGGGGGVGSGSGSGGCGGCGGAGGPGGAGGGASIAIASFSSALKLELVTLRTSDAGTGGTGGPGESGQGGGGGGTIGGCSGGLGGNGAGGAGGGGGAGGISVGVLRAGGSLDGAPDVTVGQIGTGGGSGPKGGGGTNVLGPASAGVDGTPGVDGVAKAVLEVQ